MRGEYMLLWATDVGAHYEAPHVGMEVFPSEAAALASDLVVECGERPVPIIVFVPDVTGSLDTVALAETLERFNDLNAAMRIASGS